MRGTKTSIANQLKSLLVLGAAAVALTPAAAQDYFPLQTGNNWAYKVTQGRASSAGSINVGETVEIEGRRYYKLQFFEASLLVRQAENGSIISRNAETGNEGVWLPLGTEEGLDLPTIFDSCAPRVRVASKKAKVETALGTFNNALELRYETGCNDAGTTVQYFVPYVGMVAYETTSIAGPVKHDLTWSRTGSTNVEASTNSFTAATDSVVYKAGQQAEAVARLTLRASQELVLTFPSGQSTDLRISNEKGENVYTWSADKLFTMIYRAAERVGPGEKTWVMNFPVGQLAPGRYQAEVWLTTQPKLYSATISFEVR